MAIHELTPWEDNPRTLSEVERERLDASLETYGQVEPIVIGPDGEVYNGHQRLRVLRESHGDDYAVDVRQASRALTQKERRQLTLYLHATAVGHWDGTMMETWPEDVFREAGITENALQTLVADVDVLREILNARDTEDELQSIVDAWQENVETPYLSEKKLQNKITVYFQNDDDRMAFFAKVGVIGTEKTRHIWYPEQKPSDREPYPEVNVIIE